MVTMLLLADAIAIFHGLAVVFLTAAPFVFLLSKRRIIYLERLFLASNIATVLSFITTRSCWLTDWEQQLRVAAGAPSYQGGFIQHYAAQIGIVLPVNLTVGLAVVLFVAGIWRIAMLRKAQMSQEHISDRT